MPKSDTWPGGTGLETMTGMESAGSCDSVVSANSEFSDDSLEHLSAEEKACLMFLEETIESLDTEEDSGLSNDERDQLPNPGNLASRLADLSASMSQSKLNSSQKQESPEPVKENADVKLGQSYLVPTPLVVASGSGCFVPGTKPDKNLGPKPHFAPPSFKSYHKQKTNTAPQVPLEVNVVTPPPTKPRDYSVRTAEGPLPRGPLSYDALAHLRRSASAKKTPLCPTVDHTIDSDKRPPVTREVPHFGKLSRSDSSNSGVSKSRMAPPAVAPKPKSIPAHISAKAQNEAPPLSPDSSYSVKNATDPQVVRLEALQKLGLLKEQQPEDEAAGPASPPKSKCHPSLEPQHDRFASSSNMNRSRNPSFCYSQSPTEPKNRSLQSSASFHHYSRGDQQSAAASRPSQPGRPKAPGLERSISMDNHRNGGLCPEPRRVTATEPENTAGAQPEPGKPSNSVGYTVVVVPGMGADRREALRKLGLLRDDHK